MYPKSKKAEAIRLRKEGNSFASISSKIAVSKSTLSEWLKGVQFVPNTEMRDRRIENSNRIINMSRVDRALSEKMAHDFARKQIEKIDSRDIFMFGLGIYLGEGSKTGGVVRIVNSDPRIIRFSILWFKKCFGLTDTNFRVRIHMYPDNDEEATIRFWMKALGFGRRSFQPSYIDRRINKRKDRRGILPYGTAHLGIVSNGDKNLGVLLQRKIIATIDRVLSMRD